MKTVILVLVLACAVAARAEPVTAPTNPSAINAPRTAADWVRLALERDPELAAQREDVQGAGDAVRMASAGLWPTVQLNAQHGDAERRDRPPPLFSTTGNRPLRSDQTTLTVEQVLYDGRRTRHEITAAEHRVEQHRTRLIKVGNERAVAALQAWHEWRAAEQAWLAHQQAERQMAGLVDLVRQRLQAGQLAEVDLRRAESRWLDGQRAAAQADSRRREAALQLQVLTGLAPSSGAEAQAERFNPPGAAQIEALRNQCMAACPDVRESALQVERGNAELAAARAAFHPRVALEASRSDMRNPNGASERYRTVQLMLTARWTLFDGGSRSAQVDQVGRSVQALSHRLDDARRDTLRRFDQAVIRLGDALAQHDLAVRNAAVAAEALRLARLGFEAGRRPAIEVADTVAEAARAADEAAQRDARRWIEHAQLLAVAGVLPDQLGVPLPEP